MGNEITVQSTVHKFLMLRMVSITMYQGNINQFINIINGVDYDDVRKHYPNKDIQFYKDVLNQLGVEYES